MDRKIAVLFLCALLFPTLGFAQSTANQVLPGVLVSSPCPPGYTYCYAPYSNTNPLPVTGSFSASLSGFTPGGTKAALSVTSSSGNVALPAGTVVAVTNSGSNSAHIVLSVGAGTATTSDWVLPAGATVGLTVGSNTFINAITDSSTTTLSIAGGSGLVTGYGGGGSGSSGAVTTSPITVATTDKAGTIATGGTAQSAIASNASRKGWCIQNPSAASEDLFVRVNGTASATTGTDLSPGQAVCSSPSMIDTAAVSVFAATTSHAYLGFEVQ